MKQDLGTPKNMATNAYEFTATLKDRLEGLETLHAPEMQTTNRGQTRMVHEPRNSFNNKIDQANHLVSGQNEDAIRRASRDKQERIKPQSNKTQETSSRNSRAVCTHFLARLQTKCRRRHTVLTGRVQYVPPLNQTH